MIAAATVSRETSFVYLDVALIDVAENVRIDPGELEELAASIRELGVLEPVKAIGPHADGRYRLVYGQRRLLASRKAGVATIPTILEASSDVDEPGPRRSVEQLVENLQRQDLNQIELAQACRTVLEADPKLTQAALAKRLGKHPSWLSNLMRVLETDEAVIDLVRTDKLSGTHARSLVGLAPKTQREYADRVITEGWSAHRLESEITRERDHAERMKAQEQEQAKTKVANGAKAIAALEKRKATWTDKVIVWSYYGQGDVDVIAAALRKAGYASVVTTKTGASPRSEALGCDCHAWLVSLEYGTPRVGPACVVPTHVTAKRTADDQARSAEYSLKNEGRAELERYLEAELVGLAATRPIFVRTLLWKLIGWQLKDWAKERTQEKRPDPWAVLAGLDDKAVRTEISRRLAHSTDDANGDKVPWAALLAEIRGEGQPEPRPAEPDEPADEPIASGSLVAILEADGALDPETIPLDYAAPATAPAKAAKGRKAAAK